LNSESSGPPKSSGPPESSSPLKKSLKEKVSVLRFWSWGWNSLNAGLNMDLKSYLWFYMYLELDWILFKTMIYKLYLSSSRVKWHTVGQSVALRCNVTIILLPTEHLISFMCPLCLKRLLLCKCFLTIQKYNDYP